MTAATPKAPDQIVLVTGPSGAGRLTAIRALEDLGFEAIDNLPLTLIPRLFDGRPLNGSLALGIDVRNRDFSVDGFLAAIKDLNRATEYTPELLYLDCRPDVLLRRYSETRRRHPIADDAPEDGISQEIDLLRPLRDKADVLIDTSELTPHDLRAELERVVRHGSPGHMSLSVQSFSYKRGIPAGLDTVFDVRFLKNPHWEPELRPLDGRDSRVSGYVASDPSYSAFFDRVSDLVLYLLPAYIAEGKSHFSIGFGCTGGQHRSVALTEALANALAEKDWQVSIRHRELERRGKVAR